MFRSLPSPIKGSEDAVERLPASISLDDGIACQENFGKQCYQEVVNFSIQILLPLLNDRPKGRSLPVRQQKAIAARAQTDLAWLVVKAIGPRPASPIGKCRVTIERYGMHAPDDDNLHGSVKGLVDILCLQSKTHPRGLGIITDDKHGLCETRARFVQVKHRIDQKTVVTIEVPLSS